MWGNMKEEGSEAGGGGGVCGTNSVWAAVEGLGVGGWGGMGVSAMMARRVSAATMPPMLWPMRIVWTEGSMVGEGVPAATSRSMILFWSLVVTLSVET